MDMHHLDGSAFRIDRMISDEGGRLDFEAAQSKPSLDPVMLGMMQAVIRSSGPYSADRLAEEFCYVPSETFSVLLDSLVASGGVREAVDGFDVVDAARSLTKDDYANVAHHLSLRADRGPSPSPANRGLCLPPYNLDRRSFRVRVEQDGGAAFTRPETGRFAAAVGSATVYGDVFAISKQAGMRSREALPALMELCARGMVEDLSPGSLRRALAWEKVCRSVLAALAPGETLQISHVAGRLPDYAFGQVKGALLHGVFTGTVMEIKRNNIRSFALANAYAPAPGEAVRGSSSDEIRRALGPGFAAVLDLIEKAPAKASEIQAAGNVTRQRVNQILNGLRGFGLVRRHRVRGKDRYVYSAAAMSDEEITAYLAARPSGAWPEGLAEAVSASIAARRPEAVKAFCVRGGFQPDAVEAYLSAEALAKRLLLRGGAFGCVEEPGRLSSFCLVLDPSNRGIFAEAAKRREFTLADISMGSYVKVTRFVSNAIREGLMVRSPVRRGFKEGTGYWITEAGLEIAALLSDETLADAGVAYRRERGMRPPPKACRGRIEAEGRAASVLAAVDALGTAGKREVEAVARKAMGDTPSSFSMTVCNYLTQLCSVGYLERTGTRRKYVYSVTAAGAEFIGANGLA